MNRIIIAISIIIILVFIIIVIIYGQLFGGFLPVIVGEYRSSIHDKYGLPCGSAKYKCCCCEEDDPTHADQWENSVLFGRYITYVEYKKNEEVVSVHRSFEWFFEPWFSKFKRSKENCIPYR
jgi:hypothetical protein